jgi:hypothetical protein
MNRPGRRLGELAMALVGLVLAHNLVFLAGYGSAYGAALAHTGHDRGWSAAVLAVLAMGAGLLAASAWRLRQLGVLARHVGSPQSWDEPQPARLARAWLGLALRLGLAISALFLLQENLEHLRIGERLPGLSVFGSGSYPNALVIIATVALVVASVGTLFSWRRDVLMARIRAAQRSWRREVAPLPVPLDTIDRRPHAVFRGGLAVRAPPSGIES